MLKRGLRSLVKKAGYDLVPQEKSVQRWPYKSSVQKVDFPTILIFTPPNSGSTAISQYLTSSRFVSSYRDENNEVQWLIPGLREADRWWPDKPVCYRSVAGVLQEYGRRALTAQPEARYLVEKSPPNMVRHARFVALFEDPKILINNREPYANIASQLKRYSDKGYRDLEREDVVEHLTKMWVIRSQYLQEISSRYDAPVVTYEGFCEDPQSVVSRLGLDLPDLGEDASVRVKDYGDQGITNMNAAQVAMLESADKDLISHYLKPHKEILKWFSYELA